MSLILVKKGYIKEDLPCPNCGASLILYLDDRGEVRKAYSAKILVNGIKCEHCESTLSYKPKKSKPNVSSTLANRNP